MSSFVIGKEAYIKAAGIIAGISEASNRGNGSHIWLYDYESGRNANAEDYYKRFVECYEMNALSVQEQYKDHDLESDNSKYMTTFKKAVAAGRALYYNGGEKLKKAIMELRHFFESAIYQTEKPEYMFKMQFYFNNISAQLMQFLYICEPESWGNLEIEI